MVNQEHLDILNQGVGVWNRWRKENPNVFPDLTQVNFTGSKWGGASDEWPTGLNNLFKVNFSRTDLSLSDLRFTTLAFADLSEAELYAANLEDATLFQSKLDGSCLVNSNLMRTNFNQTSLSNTDIADAIVAFTVFAGVDLSKVKGLTELNHHGPLTIGMDTLISSGGNIPKIFLQKAGFSDTQIDYARSLIGMPINYYSCFISYSSKDQAFAERIYADLQSKSVHCWFAPEEMKIGDRIRVRIDESIRIYDKLLLVLSEHALASDWVEYEVEAALAKERRDKQTVLFPVRLDKTVMVSATAWAAHILDTRHIGNFEHWKDHDEYVKAFDRLLCDLKTTR